MRVVLGKKVPKQGLKGGDEDERIQELLDRYVERYNAGDLDGVLNLYAEDAVQDHA